MDIEVDDRDPFEAELSLCRSSGDRHVVEHAEAHRAARESVMPGRTDERESTAERGLDGRARRQRRGFECRRRADGVAVEPNGILDAADELDVLGGVAQQQLLRGRGPALAPDVLVRKQYRKPLGPFGMASGRM
jgi:hypothetical protein